LLERFKQLKQKQQARTPVNSADQRSDIHELFDDQDKTDVSSDYNLNKLFKEKKQDKRVITPDYNLNELFQEKEQLPDLNAWEKLSSALDETSRLRKPHKKAQKKWHKWFSSPRKSSRKPAARKTWTEY
jgi:hypothetical protein